MKSQLIPFEEYVTSLTDYGVFPTFERNYNGWTCTLRNSANTRIMPVAAGEQCWAETMIDALTAAVENLNKLFSRPEDLQRYINTGVNQSIESLLESIESLHRIKTTASGNAPAKLNDKGMTADFLH